MGDHATGVTAEILDEPVVDRADIKLTANKLRAAGMIDIGAGALIQQFLCIFRRERLLLKIGAPDGRTVHRIVDSRIFPDGAQYPVLDIVKRQ